MKSSLLLPHYFKKVGLLLVPFGLFIWVITQLGAFDSILVNNSADVHWLKVLVLSMSSFGFLFGMFFMVFSKEKIEDEYILNIRLKSFQFASFMQFIFFILSFLYMAFFNKDPKGDGGLEAYLLICILLFWVLYIAYFNLFIMNSKLRVNEE